MDTIFIIMTFIIHETHIEIIVSLTKFSKKIFEFSITFDKLNLKYWLRFLSNDIDYLKL